MILFALCPLYIIGAGDDDDGEENANGPIKSTQPPSDLHIGNRGWKVHCRSSHSNSSRIDGNFNEKLSLD